jgi:hypothetical protein
VTFLRTLYDIRQKVAIGRRFRADRVALVLRFERAPSSISAEWCDSGAPMLSEASASTHELTRRKRFAGRGT